MAAVTCKTCAAGGQHAFTHGTNSGYTYHLCRCDLCRTARNDYERDRKQKKCGICTAGKKHEFKHGRAGYEFHECRCEICCEAMRDKWRKRKRCQICAAGKEHTFQHGRKGYEYHGCDCRICYAAIREHWRKKVKGCKKCRQNEPCTYTHDYESGFVYHGCRCNICVAAAKEKHKSDYASRDLGYARWSAARWYRKTTEDIPAPNHRKRWTPDEDAIIVRDDIQIIDMCYLLGRGYSPISARRNRLLRGLESLPAPRGGSRWTDADDAMVVRDDIEIVDLCRMLGRSYPSVVQRREWLAS